jgi:hypothetical protein
VGAIPTPATSFTGEEEGRTMAFTETSVDAVKDACEEMQTLRALVVLGQLKIAESAAGTLTNEERDAIRARMTARIQNRRAFVKAHVDTW